MKLETVKQALATLAGGTFVGIDTVTEVKLSGGKKNPQQGRITKVTTGSQVMCFSNTNGSAYDAMVKRRLVAEGKDPDTFVLGQRAWGERVQGTAFVEHKGAHYLEVIFMKAGTSQYMQDGYPIAKELIEGLPEGREDNGQGGLSDSNKVIIRTYSLDSIVAMRAMGQEWA